MTFVLHRVRGIYNDREMFTGSTPEEFEANLRSAVVLGLVAPQEEEP